MRLGKISLGGKAKRVLIWTGAGAGALALLAGSFFAGTAVAENDQWENASSSTSREEFDPEFDGEGRGPWGEEDGEVRDPDSNEDSDSDRDHNRDQDSDGDSDRDRGDRGPRHHGGHRHQDADTPGDHRGGPDDDGGARDGGSADGDAGDDGATDEDAGDDGASDEDAAAQL